MPPGRPPKNAVQSLDTITAAALDIDNINALAEEAQARRKAAPNVTMSAGITVSQKEKIRLCCSKECVDVKDGSGKVVKKAPRHAIWVPANPQEMRTWGMRGYRVEPSDLDGQPVLDLNSILMSCPTSQFEEILAQNQANSDAMLAEPSDTKQAGGNAVVESVEKITPGSEAHDAITRNPGAAFPDRERVTVEG